MSYGEHTVEEIDGETKDCWMMNHSQYFLPEFLDKAFVALIARFKNNGMMDYDNPDMVGEKLQIIKIWQTQVLRFESHYDYCDAVLNDFWMEVFGMTSEQMWCGGIVGAHGDKAYGYKDKWNEAGIPFEHGVMLFLLSYTREYGDRPKHESHQWVIENYPKYKPKLEAAENKVLKEKFKNTVD
jgi:hypothetical protein